MLLLCKEDFRFSRRKNLSLYQVMALKKANMRYSREFLRIRTRAAVNALEGRRHYDCETHNKPEYQVYDDHFIKKGPYRITDHGPVTMHKLMKQWKKELKQGFKFLKDPFNESMTPPRPLPREVDIVIIGGGAVGSSIACHMREVTRSGLDIIVLDENLSVEKGASKQEYGVDVCARSVGGIKQQFSLKEHVEMAKYSAHYLKSITDRLADVNLDPPKVDFKPFGYLTLASELGAETLHENHHLQTKLGVKNEILTPYQLNKRFPWLSTKDIAVACHGLQDEGWFDSWNYILAVRSKAMTLGVLFAEAEAVQFEFEINPHIGVGKWDCGEYVGTNLLLFRLPNGVIRDVRYSICILAAGHKTSALAKRLLYIDKKYPEPHSFEIPIEPRKRYVYCFEAANGPEISSPMVVDPTGLYVRREGVSNDYICGLPPIKAEEPSTDNLDLDLDYFYERVWPLLAERIPAFEHLKLKGGWAGLQDYNYFDETGIIGIHPAYNNIVIASGFGGCGMQHAPAIGKAIMEWITQGRFLTLDLQRFSFDRIVAQQPLCEKLIL